MDYEICGVSLCLWECPVRRSVLHYLKYKYLYVDDMGEVGSMIVYGLHPDSNIQLLLFSGEKNRQEYR